MGEESSIEYFCNNCGNKLEANILGCFKCNSNKRLIKITLSDTIAISEKLVGKVKDVKSKLIYKFRYKTKIAGKSGNLAEDLLNIDIRNKIKKHIVKEFESGAWRKVHDENVLI